MPLMSSMANPMDALKSYQKNASDYLSNPNEMDGDYLKLKGPKGNGFTYDYIKVVDGEVQALAIFAIEEPYRGVPRFSVGYAVAEKHRRCGLGFEAINKGIEELKNEGRHARILKFYIEALIDKTNTASIHLAKKIFSGDGHSTFDSESGTPSLLFYKLIEI